MVGGDAVLEAVGPAGVLGHVAADGARGLARRVGHVVQAERRDRLGEPRVHDAGLEHRAAPRPDRRARMRFIRVSAMSTASPSATAPPRVRCPAPRATKGTPSEMQQPDDLAHLGGVAGHHHHAGIRLPGGKPVHGVGGELGPAVAHPARAHDAAKRLDQIGVMVRRRAPAACRPCRWCGPAGAPRARARRRW